MKLMLQYMCKELHSYSAGELHFVTAVVQLLGCGSLHFYYIIWRFDKLTFGEKIRLLRTQNNLTQGQVASLSGLSLRTIINYENHGKSPQKRETYSILAGVFNVDETYLIQDENNDYITATKKKINSNKTNKTIFLLNEIKDVFQDKNISDSEKENLMIGIQESYWKSKIKSRKKASANKT